MSRKRNDIVLAPLEDGNQRLAIRSNADIVCFTGGTGGGKSVALYYAPIEHLAMNDNAKIVCFMRNVSDFWGAGKVNDTLKKMYPLIDRSVKKQPHDPIGEIIRNQTDMGMKLYNGSEIKFQQLDNENPIVIDKITKGLQAKKLIFDECNKFLWRTISAFFPRLRSDSSGKAQVYLAQNPERECFMRKMCGKGEHGGGWINDDGTVDKSMDGVVMFFCMPNGDLDKCVWGRTKREVYEKCKDHIDSLLAVDPDMTYEDFILSMAFFTFDVRDNKKMLSKNKGYRGLAANSATAASAYQVNWNYSINDEEENIDDSVYGTPIESTTYKFAKALQKRFGVIKDITDHDYITNSYHVNVREKIDAFTKLKFESEFQKLSPGGAISYVETSNLSHNIDAVMEVLKYIYDNIMYAELNTKSDYCQVCGYDGEISIKESESGRLYWECPNCGNKDQRKMNVCRRTCGYLGSQFWNQGRTEEIRDRFVHLGNDL